jgi:hypothetical protein
MRCTLSEVICAVGDLLQNFEGNDRQWILDDLRRVSNTFDSIEKEQGSPF